VVNGKGMKDRELPVIPRLEAILRRYLTEVRESTTRRPYRSATLPQPPSRETA